MPQLTGLFVTLLLVCLTYANLSYAQAPERDVQKEEKLWQQLQKTAPKSVETFKEATIALDRKNYPEAIKLYNQVLAQSPDFEPALRRLGYALIGTGQREEGLKMTKKAVDLNRSPDNLLGYAYNLVNAESDSTYKPTQTELEQALVYSKEAMQKDGGTDPDYATLVAQISLYLNKSEEFNSATELLKEKFPNSSATHYFNGIRLANYGAYSSAEDEIKQAETLGLPHQSAQEMLTAIEKAKSEAHSGPVNYLFYGLYLVGAWLLGLATLFGVGKILSNKTLHSIENSDPNDITGGGQAGLRKFYKILISTAGIYYYISQPIVMLLVIAFTLGVIGFFIWLGRIPIQLVLTIGVVGLATIFYMLKAFFVRHKIEDPGRILREDEAPELWALTRDVAQTLGTRPVDEIRITHASELAVYDRGGIRAKMQDKAERILIIGAATLKGFSQNAFRAVLAHEYGHFSNRDTAGGDVAFRVNADILSLARSMGESGTATFYNIAFQFLRFYHFLFRRITHGASRLQEILADRVAVYHFGGEAFKEGLSHVILRDLEFHHLAEKEINAAYNNKRPMQNLYNLTIDDESINRDLNQQFGEYISRPTTEDDSHPSPQDRFKLIAAIKSKEIIPISGEVWDLFKDREGLTNELNSMLETRLKNFL